MGLDQYAYTRDHDVKPSDAEPKFVWRKHAKLPAIPGKLTLATNLPSDARPVGCRDRILPDRTRFKRPAGGFCGDSIPRIRGVRRFFVPRAHLSRRRHWAPFG